ncbi:MAG: hypothetical protein KatS3mg105_3310 [Gemmatales bacterium]|nr:MAG: hypothetical protein KatS3mg105_3310 [Gemmatales bacterium]
MAKRVKPQSDKLGAFWNDINTQLMVTACHRYCLGRRSYIVGACVDWLYKHRRRFEDKTKLIIVRDTVDAILSGQAGDDNIDVPRWVRLAACLYDELPPCYKELLEVDKIRRVFGGSDARDGSNKN